MSSYNINIFASFSKDSLVDTQQRLSNYKDPSLFLNSTPVNQTCSISAHNYGDITNLVITSNGIMNGNFNIFPIKFAGERINFVVNLVDYLGYQVKDYSLLNYNNFTFTLSALNGNNITGVSFQTDFGTLSSLTQGGFFKGYLYCPFVVDDVSIKAIYTDANISLTGYSTIFDINSSCGGEYQIRKINEDFDQTKAFKSIGTQPVLFDKSQFFDNFLGQIVGDANSDPNTLGIEVFEKIANYVANINDPDFCNLESLKSLLDLLNVDYQNYNYEYPPSFKRLVDILSVKHKNLFGQTNQYQTNFNSKGYINSDKYGINKGPAYNFSTTTFLSSVAPFSLITYEKFSKTYNLVSTVIPGISSYALSAVNSNFGWNLVLPPGVSGADIPKYYEFFSYVPDTENSLLQKFIDFDNKNTTLSITNSGYNEYIKTGGIMDNILLNNLLTNLQIISCLPNEVNLNIPTSTPTPSPTLTSTPTVTPTVTSSSTPAPTITLTTTSTPTSTPTPTLTQTPTLTLTPTLTPTLTLTPSSIAIGAGILYVSYDQDILTPTPTPTLTQTGTSTPTPTSSLTSTPTPTPTPSNSLTSTPTPTLSGSTPTPTVTVTSTPTPTLSGSTPTPTPTLTPTPTTP